MITQDEFAEEIANYIKTHKAYDVLNKHDVVVETVKLLLNDIGACQNFLNVRGIKIDLYTYRFEESENNASNV